MSRKDAQSDIKSRRLLMSRANFRRAELIGNSASLHSISVRRSFFDRGRHPRARLMLLTAYNFAEVKLWESVAADFSSVFSVSLPALPLQGDLFGGVQ